MKMPHVSNLIQDPRLNVVFDVRAYRKLTKQELIRTVRHYYATTKKKPKKNTSVIIMSLYGIHGR